MDLRDYLQILRRQAWIILACTLIGLSIGTVNGVLTPARYQTSTSVLVAVQAPPGASTNDLAQANNFARQGVTSYVALATSSVVLNPVISGLGLDTTPAALASKIKVSAPTNSLVITFTVTDRNPGRAAMIANATAESFQNIINNDLEERSGDKAAPLQIVQLESASIPLKPSAPNVPLAVGLGALIGLAVGIGIAVLRTVLDQRVRSTRQVEQAVDAPMLGGIYFDPDSARTPLVMLSDPHSPRSEAFRTLRTNIQFLRTPGKASVFVTTSAGPGEGKSTTTANLALALAETGLRVALVDADLRKPRVADILGIEGGLGLSDVLAHRVTLSGAMQRFGRGALFVLPAGTPVPNPAEMLGSRSMHRVLDELRDAFDIVLIDAPPVLLVTDAAILARITSGALMVVASGRTTLPRLRSAVQTIEGAGARLRGTVVTMLPTSGADAGNYGGYTFGASNEGVVAGAPA